MDLNLSKIEDREKYISRCEKNLISDLREINLFLSEEATACIRQRTIEIGVNYENREGVPFDFGSEVKIYIEDESRFAVGSSGSFSPLNENNRSSYWRIVHGGEIVKNWESILPIVKKHWRLVNKLYDIPVLKDS